MRLLPAAPFRVIPPERTLAPSPVAVLERRVAPVPASVKRLDPMSSLPTISRVPSTVLVRVELFVNVCGTVEVTVPLVMREPEVALMVNAPAGAA